MTSYLNFLEDDLGSIMESHVFDEPMIFDPDGNGHWAFRGIFSAPTHELNPGTVSNSVLAQDYTVACKESDLPRRLIRGDTIKARGKNWRVYKILSDGQGLLTASIQEAN